LSVAHGIVSAHGGAITLKSRPGAGSCFDVYLPLAGGPPDERLPAAADPPTAEASPGRGRHVLYVDDDEVMLLMVERLLQRIGYRVTCCQGTAEALEVVLAAPSAIDIVVTDYNMPGSSGLELAQALARIRPDLPVVISSGYISEELRTGAERVGVHHLLQKQNTFEELAGLLRRVLAAEG